MAFLLFDKDSHYLLIGKSESDGSNAENGKKERRPVERRSGAWSASGEGGAARAKYQPDFALMRKTPLRGFGLVFNFADGGDAADLVPGIVGVAGFLALFDGDAHELVAEKERGGFVDFPFVDLDFHALAEFPGERPVDWRGGVLENFFKGLLLHGFGSF